MVVVKLCDVVCMAKVACLDCGALFAWQRLHGQVSNNCMFKLCYIRRMAIAA